MKLFKLLYGDEHEGGKTGNDCFSNLSEVDFDMT